MKHKANPFVPQPQHGKAAPVVLAASLALLTALVVAAVAWLNLRGDGHAADTPVLQPGPLQAAAQVARGRSLALIGNCAGCHTAPGGADYAGGAALQTPFGTVYGGNLTPDPDTGLGRWSSHDFWRALHNGRSRDGRLLNPAFPYDNFSLVSREDSDALYAYLQTLPAVKQASTASSLQFPANTQWGLALWRALYFHPKEQISQPLPRGEYLTRGLAHCSACHAPRNALGAQTATDDFRGQGMPGGRAFAPPLPPQGRADTGPWTTDDLVAYLKTGHSRQGAALGLMAEVVFGSTQHVAVEDLRDMAAWVLSRPGITVAAETKAAATATTTATTTALALGERVYADHCASCHGDKGQGAAGIYPPLAGNPRVARDPATNLIRVILEGGFGPATPGQPRPFGMPPFGHVLQPEEVAAVATFIRRTWNAPSSEVTPLDVLRHR